MTKATETLAAMTPVALARPFANRVALVVFQTFCPSLTVKVEVKAPSGVAEIRAVGNAAVTLEVALTIAMAREALPMVTPVMLSL